MENSVNFFDTLTDVDADKLSAAWQCFEHFKCDDEALHLENFAELSGDLFVKPDGGKYEIEQCHLTEMFESFDLNADCRLDWNEFQTLWSELIFPLLKPCSAILVIDVQNDFIDGTLALKNCPALQDGEEVVEVINNLLETVNFHRVFYSLDWHPEDHISFFDNLFERNLSHDSLIKAADAKVFDIVIFEGPPQQEQKLWPKHCVQKSWGSQLHKDLKLPADAVPVYKGSNPNIDSYSAFWDNNKLSQTELYRKLKDIGTNHVFVTGLATDFCVGYTTVDSLEFGFRTFLVDDAARGVDPDGIKLMKDKIFKLGGLIISSDEVLNLINGKDRRPEVGLFSARSLRRKSQ